MGPARATFDALVTPTAHRWLIMRTLVSDSRDDDVPDFKRAPQGFALLRGSAGRIYLACNDDLAESYAVRVVTGEQVSIAQRVRRDAANAIPGATPGSVVWNLGELDATTRVAVHRPFGLLLEF